MATLFVNRLTVIDASLLDPERGLLGQSWLLDVEIDGALDHQGMVLDFAEVKRRIKTCVDREFDHRLLVPANYAGFSREHSGANATIRFALTSGEAIEHRGPVEACTLLEAERVDAASLEAAIGASLAPQLPASIDQVRLHLHTEAIEGASYQYSHGLKLHQGNCQRIAHGHRSRIEIYRNGARSPRLEEEWARHWRDVYLANRADLEREFSAGGVRYRQFGYRAEQGRFALTLPAHACRLLDHETTVENLAQHIRTSLEREDPGALFRVIAFEGVEKGAVSASAER